MAHAVSLLYHDVVLHGEFEASGFQSPDANRYKLDEQLFDAHLEAIAARVVPGGRLFTFDDGGRSATAIAARLSARGWRGHFFVPTDFIGRPGFLQPAEIRAIAENGHVIGSHSCSHPLRMSSLDPARLQREWVDSRRALEDIVGGPVTTASIPGGYYSRRVAAAALEAGYTRLFTSEPVTRPWRIGSLRVYGRYAVWRDDPPALAAALAAGRLRPRVRQYLAWNAKKALKRAGGRRWLWFRRLYFARGAQRRL